MAFYRGLSGYISLGGQVQGAVFINGALLANASAIAIDGNGGTLLGVVAAGDTLTIGGETGSPVHTVTGPGPFPLVANAANFGITPNIVAGGVADNAGVTITSNAVAQVKSWSLSVTQEELDTSSMGDPWKSCVGGQANWTGQLTAHLDYGDPRQKAIIDKIITATPVSSASWLVLGVERSSAPSLHQFYGQALLKDAQITEQLGQIAAVQFSFSGSGSVLPQWTP